MAKKFYCLTCGIELIHSRKAVPGKGAILDLITPHECEGYSIKSNSDENPTVEDVLENLASLSKTVEEASESLPSPKGFPLTPGVGDKRNSKDVKTSTAPDSLIKDLNSMPNSEPEDEVA